MHVRVIKVQYTCKHGYIQKNTFIDTVIEIVVICNRGLSVEKILNSMVEIFIVMCNSLITGCII